MKAFSILFVLGLIDACSARSMEPLAIKKIFGEAKYAFKFRVISDATEECFGDSFAVTTPEPTIASTRATIPTTTSSAIQTTVKSTAHTTRRRTTTDSPSRSTTIVTQEETTKATATRNTSPSANSTTNTVQNISTGNFTTVQIPTTTRESFLTNTPAVITEGNGVQNSPVTHGNPSTGPATTQSPNEQQTTLPLDENPVNGSESTKESRKKRSCQFMVYHQDIIIGRRHIYKACNEINAMKRVQEKNEKYLKSTIRLNLGYSELKPNRNYFFMGRAVPGQDSADYVFMADELTVVNWKTSAWKLKKYLRSNGGRCN